MVSVLDKSMSDFILQDTKIPILVNKLDDYRLSANHLINQVLMLIHTRFKFPLKRGYDRLELSCILVLATRAPENHLDNQTLKYHPSGYPNLFMSNFLKCQFQAYNKTFFHLNIIPMTLSKDIIPYFNE